MGPSMNEELADTVEHLLEHRWGRRAKCRARVRLSTSAGITGSGRIRNISSSGAFIETAAELPLYVKVDLVIFGNESAVHPVELAATVVRVEGDGIGVEWCKTPACSICVKIGCTTRCADNDEGG